MIFPTHFIAAGESFSTLTDYVPAPYFRKSFHLAKVPTSASLLICGLGFYELYINGKKITKGALAPYISSPDDLIFYDRYEINLELLTGKNVIGVCLGNGFQNNPGGYVWDFDKARWRGAPKLALKLVIQLENEDPVIIESDESFKTAPSPIYNDDYRNGEYYDARREISGWHSRDFDDCLWNNAIPAEPPLGEAVLCDAEPIVISDEIKPVSVTALEHGFLYDFGINSAGVCRLEIEGEAGQTVSLYHGEHLINGKLDMRNIAFDENDYVQKDIFICKGNKKETHVPSFTYHGFQYVFVKGLTPKQATTDALTFLVMNSDLPVRGGFHCSDHIANTLQQLTRRSTLSNFYYFPTDCPQREKNGWTGDAALSAEHTLLNLGAEKSYRVWLKSIRKSQAENGSLPGIVPTAGWGFAWGNGPAWDCVLIYIPYFVYLYRGDKEILKENVHSIVCYLDYLSSKIRDDGLICFGLGDWCPPGRGCDQYKSPLEFTDTIISMDMCEKAAYIFGELGLHLQQDFAQSFYNKLRNKVRSKLIDFDTMTAKGDCQTSQAMAIFYSAFEENEKAAAFQKLLEIIRRDNNLMDTGVLGARVLFHVLSDFGYSDLAYQMITTEEFPSYGYWVRQGATTLWEDFRKDNVTVGSLNHHFWGDISHWFIRHIAGICYHPQRRSNEVDISPSFIFSMQYAEGFYDAPEGKISVQWERKDHFVLLNVTVPDFIGGNITLKNGYSFEDGLTQKPVASGTYKTVIM